jgi:hypothetical protein
VEERRQEQKEREDKVFLTSLPPLRRRFTVAKPFQLSTNRGDALLEDEGDSDYDY